MKTSRHAFLVTFMEDKRGPLSFILNRVFFRPLLIFSVFLLGSSVSYAQKADTLIKKLDSLHKVEEKPENKPVIDINKEDYTAQTNITFKTYFILLGTDMVQETTGPFHASKKTWIKVGEFAVLEGGLFFADKAIQKNSQIFMTHNPGFKNISQYITDFGASYEVYTLAAFGAYGLIFKSNKVKTTTLLATQSYIAAGAMSYAVKFLTGRRRPNSFTPENENNFMFQGPALSSGNNSFNSSFPSGHTTAAFSAATVFAEEYRDEILIPVIAYSAATLVGLSRVTQNAHWATDVFAGAALGYITGKQVVYNYHRYAKLQAGKVKTAAFFNLQYNNGVFIPSLTYIF